MSAAILQAQQMIRDRTTDLLVETFELTDELMSAGLLNEHDFLAIATTRGWIIDELATRNELSRIGLEDASA